MKIAFVVPGKPVPKARARTVRLNTGRTITYTPKETENYEAWVRQCAKDVRPETLLDMPLELSVCIYLPRPKTRPKHRKYPDGRPDLDNIVKSIKDACNGYIWTDDSRIVRLEARKEYGEPRVEVTIREVL